MFFVVCVLSFIFCLDVRIQGLELIHVHVLSRHGFRTPLRFFEYDKHKDYEWPVENGEITPKGMREQYDLGKRLMNRYTKEYKLISPVYNPKHINVFSTNKNRALSSAQAQMAGFFSKSKGGFFGKKNKDWPFDWIPIPIHSDKLENDYLLNVKWNCSKLHQLIEERHNKEEFLMFQRSFDSLFKYVALHTNETINSVVALKRVYGTVRVEKQYFGLDQPKWLTDDIFEQMATVVNRSLNYRFGGPAFGIEEDLEQIKLRSGHLLYKMIQNMEEMINQKEVPKYVVYNAHDSTVVSFANTLNLGDVILKDGQIDYSASFVIELWQGDDKYYVKVLYSKNAYADYEVMTNLIPGCPDSTNSKLCPFSTFKDRSEKYVLADPLNHCDTTTLY
uniref:Testicular acid phosphatase homolog n=1 Tax=Rhabditophanes sp. KR3021 TaxID=114890 RepID=A0AC35UEX7_9BILA